MSWKENPELASHMAGLEVMSRASKGIERWRGAAGWKEKMFLFVTDRACRKWATFRAKRKLKRMVSK